MTDAPRHKLIQGDCLDVMRTWPDDHVDLVFGSPPYEDARTYGLPPMPTGEAWVEWMVERTREMLRVCRGLVVINCEGRTRNRSWSATPVLLAADLKRAGFTLRKPPLYIRWGVPGSGGNDWVRNRYEFCVCVTKTPGPLPWADNVATGRKPIYTDGGATTNRRADGKRAGTDERTGYMHSERKKDGRLIQRKYAKPEIANPGNLIEDDGTPDEFVDVGAETDYGMGNENEAPFHPKLPRFFVRSFCPPGGTVCDPFVGGGTTAMEAIRFGRNIIGIDVRDSQIELTRNRIRIARRKRGFGLLDGK